MWNGEIVDGMYTLKEIDRANTTIIVEKIDLVAASADDRRCRAVGQCAASQSLSPMLPTSMNTHNQNSDVSP